MLQWVSKLCLYLCFCLLLLLLFFMLGVLFARSFKTWRFQSSNQSLFFQLCKWLTNVSILYSYVCFQNMSLYLKICYMTGTLCYCAPEMVFNPADPSQTVVAKPSRKVTLYHNWFYSLSLLLLIIIIIIIIIIRVITIIINYYLLPTLSLAMIGRRICLVHSALADLHLPKTLWWSVDRGRLESTAAQRSQARYNQAPSGHATSHQRSTGTWMGCGQEQTSYCHWDLSDL